MADEDSQTCSVNIWCESCPNDEYSVYCKLCNKIFIITIMGFGPIIKKHKACLNSYLRLCFCQSLDN